MKSYCIISFSFLTSFSLIAMEPGCPPEKDIKSIVIVRAVARNNVGAGLSSAIRLRYSREDLHKLVNPQNEEDKKNREQFVETFSNQRAALEAAIKAVNDANAAKEQQTAARQQKGQQRRNNLTRSTP